MIKIEELSIEELKPYDLNAKKHTPEQVKKIAESINRFGFNNPILIDKNNEIIAGHGRLLAAKRLKLEKIPIIRIENLTPDEIKAFRIADNKLNECDWDKELLKEELKNLCHDLELIKLTGLESDEIAMLTQNKEFEEDEAPELPTETIIKEGDLIELGPHRLVCGDSTSSTILDKLMNGEKASMVFTDPPYNVDYQGGMNAFTQNSREGIMNDKMPQEDFYKFLYDFLKESMKHCKGAYYVCMGNSQIHTLRNAFEQAGGHWQNYIIWVKNQFTITRGDYQHQYEVIMYGWNKETTNHYFIDNRDLSNVWEDLKKTNTKYDGEYTTISFSGFEVKIKGKAEGTIRKRQFKTDIWRHNKPTKSGMHPTMKPIELCATAINNSSKPGEIVLDSFAGSGSTLIAAEQTNRKCYSIELDPKYADVIITRWCEYTHTHTVKINGAEVEWKH